MKKLVIFFCFFFHGCINLSRERKSSLPTFNALFVDANKALKGGNIDGLKTGISLLVKSLSVAGPFAHDMRKAIKSLLIALEIRERTGTSWSFRNRDIHNDSLAQAWSFINAINKGLIKKGLGWHY